MLRYFIIVLGCHIVLFNCYGTSKQSNIQKKLEQDEKDEQDNIRVNLQQYLSTAYLEKESNPLAELKVLRYCPKYQQLILLGRLKELDKLEFKKVLSHVFAENAVYIDDRKILEQFAFNEPVVVINVSAYKEDKKGGRIGRS